MEEKTLFGFSVALNLLNDGKAVARAGWNNPNISVHKQVPDENSKMTKPYLYMVKTVVDKVTGTPIKDDVFPLDLSCESIFAEDWFEVIQ